MSSFGLVIVYEARTNINLTIESVPSEVSKYLAVTKLNLVLVKVS